MYDIKHCFICRPSDSIVSEDAGIANPGQLRLQHWLSHALTTRPDLIHPRLDLIHITWLDLIHQNPYPRCLLPAKGASCREGGEGEIAVFFKV
jgi:hypothetical protein